MRFHIKMQKNVMRHKIQCNVHVHVNTMQLQSLQCRLKTFIVRSNWLFLVRFHQHPSCLYVRNRTARSRPEHICRVVVNEAGRARCKPPATAVIGTVVSGHNVVVVVRSGKRFSITGPAITRGWNHGISGVSAVPVHRQLVQTSLVTDGERRVFSPVPLTVSTLDLQ